MAENKDRYRAETVVRILGTDIAGNKKIYAGLTNIKGVSWAVSNAICKRLKIDKNKLMSALNEKEIEQIEQFLKNPQLPEWLLNRRKDLVTGENKHLITTELDMQKEFDIRRLKKIKSYKGIRHGLGLPVRGQRTRSHFRKGRAIGVSKAKAKPGAAPKKAAEPAKKK